MTHAARIVTIQLGDTTLRIIDQHGELITTVPRLSDGEISRFKAYGTRQPRSPAVTAFARQRGGQTSGQGDLSWWHRAEPG
jgi:hypothetical protein